MNNDFEDRNDTVSPDVEGVSGSATESSDIKQPNFILVQQDAGSGENDIADGRIDKVLARQLNEYERDSAAGSDENSAEKEIFSGSVKQTEPEIRTSPSSSRADEFDYRYARPEKKTRVKKERKTPSSILLVAVCLVVSLVGSYIGGYYGMNKAMKANGGTVLYQAVQRTDEDGDDIPVLSVEDTAELVKSSVVEITTETVMPSSGFFVQEYVTEGAGSGVIISDDGYIVTNNHVIEGASSIKVRTIDGTEYTAKLIGTDSRTDLAVIKVEASALKAAVFGTSNSLKVGESVIAVGNPLGELGGTVTDGIISALEREMTIESQKMSLLQTNAAVNPGNSGGGLFNLHGELVGIVNAKSSGSGIEGLGFAIPVDDAKIVIEELIDIGYVSGRAYMGVTLIDIQDYMTAASYRVNKYGTYILEVEENSAADKAGLRPGDYVEAVDDIKVNQSSDVIEAIGSKSVGETVMMYIERNGEDLSIEVTLGEYIPIA